MFSPPTDPGALPPPQILLPPFLQSRDSTLLTSVLAGPPRARSSTEVLPAENWKGIFSSEHTWPGQLPHQTTEPIVMSVPSSPQALRGGAVSIHLQSSTAWPQPGPQTQQAFHSAGLWDPTLGGFEFAEGLRAHLPGPTVPQTAAPGCNSLAGFGLSLLPATKSVLGGGS